MTFLESSLKWFQRDTWRKSRLPGTKFFVDGLSGNDGSATHVHWRRKLTRQSRSHSVQQGVPQCGPACVSRVARKAAKPHTGNLLFEKLSEFARIQIVAPVMQRVVGGGRRRCQVKGNRPPGHESSQSLRNDVIALVAHYERERDPTTN